MQNRILLVATLLAATPATAPALVATLARRPPAAPLEELLRSSEHEDLGEAIAEYFRARQEVEDIDEALEELQEAFEDAQDSLDEVPLLSAVEDLEKAFFLANEYENSGVRKGRGYEAFAREEDYDEAVPYLYHLPRKYDVNKGPYPLLLCIPDVDQSMEEYLETEWMHNDLLSQVAVVVVKMPENIERWKLIEREGNDWGGAARVMLTFGDVTKQYAIDPDRVFLCGRGLGVDAASYIAAMYPTRFAGLIGRTGDVADVPVESFTNLPTYFAGGGAGCTAFRDRAQELKLDNCTLEPAGTEQMVWAWIQQQVRNANPEHLRMAPVDPRAGQCYWMRLEGIDVENGASVEATIDRARNLITVEGTGVAGVVLYFNDLLVDMERPIRVSCNGVEHEQSIPRNLNTLLDLAFTSGDPGRIYTATQRFDFPVVASDGEN